MNFTISHATRVALILAAQLFSFNATFGATAPASEKTATTPAQRTPDGADLVINKGTFEHNGRRTPATLRNVVDALQERYPRANITLIRSEDVPVGDITLRWGRRGQNTNEVSEPSLHGVLAALRAASRQPFSVDSFGANDFMLVRQSGDVSDRRVEVFKLGPLLRGSSIDADTNRQLKHAEVELAVLSRRHTENHPQVSDIKDRVEVLKGLQSRNSQPQDIENLLNQIRQIVTSTLEELKPDERTPDFKYHPGAGLLVVIGTDHAIDVTRKVIAALH